MNAALLTLSTAGSLLFALQARLLVVTDRFASAVRAVTGGYFLALLAAWALSLVGVRLPGLLSGGPVAIGAGLLSAGLAASNLLLDFEFLRRAERAGAPAWMEWYGAQSVCVTLVWMYTEVLRLLVLLGGGRGDD
jgi:uncharacterized YccA/Bax inhibitor family protein